MQQTLGNVTSLVRATATQMQNQYNGMSLSRLESEFGKPEAKIRQQQAVVEQTTQALE